MRILVLLVVAFLATNQQASAQFGALKSALGGGSSSSSGPSAGDSQEALVLRAHAALVNILEGQRSFALAFGYDDKAKSLGDSVELIKKDPSKDGLKTAVNLAEDTNAMIKEAAENKVQLSAEQSKHYNDGLVQFAQGTYHIVKLGPEIAQWGKSAQSEIAGAGVMGLAKLQQKLSTGLFLFTTLPKLIPAFLGTLTGDVIGIGKSNKLDTSGANEANFN
jgi:hypothetical protein